MKVKSDSARLLGRLLGSIDATEQDAIVIGLLLETEEDVQTFFAWFRSLTTDPTPQECFEKAVELSGILEDNED